MPTSDQKQMRVDYLIEKAKLQGVKLPTGFVINAQGARSWAKIKALYEILKLDWQRDVPAEYSKAEEHSS